MILTCQQCEETFTTRNRNRKYCSRECYAAVRMVRVPKECLSCGEDFLVAPHDVKNRKYCSVACKNIGIRKDGPRRDGHRAYRRVCRQCSSEYWVFHLASKRKYCSPSCSHVAHTTAAEMQCGTCGKTILVEQHKLHDRKSHHCSVSCYMKSRTWKNRRGHTRGRGGKRPDLDNIYFRSSWESNYARILNHLMDRYIVREWEFEPDVIDLGDETYLPDFKVTSMDGSVVYHEVKGYMTKKAKRKISKATRLIPLILIDELKYKALEQTYDSLPHWE